MSLKKKKGGVHNLTTSVIRNGNSRRRSGSAPRSKTRSKRNKSAENAENTFADDMTRHMVALARIKKKKGTVFDYLQTMPMEIQNEIYSMVREDKPINSRSVKRYSGRIHLQQLINKRTLDKWIYDKANFVFRGESIYNTEWFTDNDSNNQIWYNDELFASSIGEFEDKTRIEYNMTGDYVRFRVVPKTLQLHLVKNASDYDGFIVADTFVEDPMGPENYRGRPDLHPDVDERTRSFIRTHFSHLSERTMSIDQYEYRNHGPKFTIAYLEY